MTVASPDLELTTGAAASDPQPSCATTRSLPFQRGRSRASRARADRAAQGRSAVCWPVQSDPVRHDPNREAGDELALMETPKVGEPGRDSRGPGGW
jgi:hypothetical protein